MASSGLVTTMIMAFAEYLTAFSVVSFTTPKFFSTRSSRLMPGLRANPAVTMMRSELAVGS